MIRTLMLFLVGCGAPELAPAREDDIPDASADVAPAAQIEDACKWSVQALRTCNTKGRPNAWTVSATCEGAPKTQEKTARPEGLAGCVRDTYQNYAAWCCP